MQAVSKIEPLLLHLSSSYWDTPVCMHVRFCSIRKAKHVVLTGFLWCGSLQARGRSQHRSWIAECSF